VARGDGGNRGGVAPFRLEQDGAGRHADGGELLGDETGIGSVGDDNGLWMEARLVVEAQHGFLEDGLVGDEAVELFGAGLVRNGPEARAGAAAHDDRMDCHDCCLPCFLLALRGGVPAQAPRFNPQVCNICAGLQCWQ